MSSIIPVRAMAMPNRRGGLNGKHTSTTRLPAALRDELGITEGAADGGGGKLVARRDRAAFFATRGRGSDSLRGRLSRSTMGVLGRKEARKSDRRDKRAARAQHHDQQRRQPDVRLGQTRVPTATTVSPFVPPPGTSDAKLGSGKGKAKASEEAKVPNSKKKMNRPGQRKHVGESVQTPLQRMLQQAGGEEGSDEDAVTASKSSKPNRKRAMDRAAAATTSTNLSFTERHEEDEIAWLEAHLGSGARKKAKRQGATDFEGMEEDDGLDDLLDDLDHFYPGMYDDQGGEREDAGFDSGDDENGDEDDEDEEEGGNEYDNTEGEDDHLDNHLDVDMDADDDDDEESEIGKIGRLDAQQESSAGRYIPPALRRQQIGMISTAARSEDEQKLRRSAKGLLNRLGENNVEQIVSDIEALYRQHSRAQATACLTDLILDTISSSDNISETFVVLYATLAASLHRIVGVEFGAQFVQSMVERFLQHHRQARAAASHDPTVGKESRNLAALLASLYNLGVVACPLMYDVVRHLLGVQQQGDEAQQRVAMTELDTDVLLKIVKMCGVQLRHDDPTSLKAIVYLAHEQQGQGDSNGAPSTTRAKFMLEALSDLRNNRSRATTASAGAEVLAKMRKFLGGLAKKHTVRTHESLRVGLADLRNVDRRGKWWLVGAAWAGYEFADKAGDGQVRSTVSRSELAADEHEEEGAKLAQLARQHGMNTAIRQQIFITLLSSQDYLDAVQRLLALTHKKTTQRREIVRVLLHCLGREPTFNPYYVVVGARLAREDGAGTRITLQYCLWDYMRQLGEKSVGGQSIVSRNDADDDDDDDNNNNEEEEESGVAFGGKGAHERSESGMANVARAYGWWMAKNALGLDVLRAVDFTSLKRAGTSFLQQLFIHLLLSVHAASPVQTLTTTRRGSTDASNSNASRAVVETVFVQGTRANQRVAQGLMIFFETQLQSKQCRTLAKQMGAAPDTIDSLLRSRSVALETVRVGSRVAANNDATLLDEDM